MRYLQSINGPGDKARGFPKIIPWMPAQAKRTGEYASISEKEAKVFLAMQAAAKVGPKFIEEVFEEEEVVTPSPEEGVETEAQADPEELVLQPGPPTIEPWVAQFKGDAEAAKDWLEEEFSVVLDGRIKTMKKVEEEYERLQMEVVPGD